MIPMTNRKRPKQATEAEVLTHSRRRCCICFGLKRDVEVKAGQIAHLDGDSSNSAPDNLAFLCFEHHDQYDSRTSQSKNFTVKEVKRYRDELHEKVLPIIEAGTVRQPLSDHAPPKVSGTAEFDEKQRQELQEIILEVLADGAAPLRSISYLASKVRISSAIAERLLFQLVQEGTLRVDRPRGSRNRTYSLSSSLENRLLDTFVATLGEDVESEVRYPRSRRGEELDSVIRTVKGSIYAVEIMFARKGLRRNAVETRLKSIAHAKSVLGVEDALSVVLIGITDTTRPSQQDLSALENEGVLIKYVELDEGPNQGPEPTERTPRLSPGVGQGREERI